MRQSKLKAILFCLALVFLSPLAYARTKFQGFVERGGQKALTTLVGTSTYVQRSCPNAPIVVYEAGTVTPATIYSDSAGTSKSATFSADANGYWYFYGDAGSYDIQQTCGGTFTLSDFGGSASANAITVLPTGVAATDTARLQSAITAAASSCREIQLGSGNFSINAPLLIPSSPTCPIHMRGYPNNYTGSAGTHLVASTAMAQLITVASQYHVFDDMVFDGNRLATDVVLLTNATLVDFNRCIITHGKRDGIHLNASGINQGISLDRTFLISNGTYFTTTGIDSAQFSSPIRTATLTGTAAISASSATVTISGGTDLTLLSPAPRKGDLVRVGYTVPLTSLTSSTTTATGTTAAAHGMITGANITISGASPAAYNGNYTIVGVPTTTTFTYTFAGGTSPATGTIKVNSPQSAFYGQIDTVSASVVTLQGASSNLPTVSLSAQDYSIGVGDGWYSAAWSANDSSVFTRSFFRANAGCGIRSNALYGNHVISGYADYNYMCGVSIGVIDNAGATRDTQIDHLYMEFQPVDYVIGTAFNMVINIPTQSGVGATGNIFMVGGSAATGEVCRNGFCENMSLGAPQNFTLQVRNSGGVLQHRVTSDWIGGGAECDTCSKVTGHSITYANTPTVSSVVAFTSGGGLRTGGIWDFLLNTATDQNSRTSNICSVEGDSTLVGPYTCTVSTQSSNVNGVTLRRPAVQLYKNGVLQNWDTTTVPLGTFVALRISGYFK